MLGNRIKELRALGYSYSQIQKELDCSKGTISYHLGEGQKTKHKNRLRDKRNKVVKYLQEYKESKGCADCGENYPYWILEFDHLRDKKFNLSDYKQYNMSFDDVVTEVEKCEVVCANCHRTRTRLRLLR